MVTKFHRRTIQPDEARRAQEAVTYLGLVQPGATPAPAPANDLPVTPPSAQAKPSAADLVARQDPLEQSSSRWQVGQVVHVPTSKIRSNPWNPRIVYRPSAIDEMAQSLLERGQQIPALGYVDEASREVVLIEGETRFRGAKAAGIPTLRVEIHPAPAGPKELYEMARSANVDRNDQTPLDDAFSWKRLLEAGVYPSQAALARAMKVQEAHVSRTLGLQALPEKYLTTIAEYPHLMSLRMLDALRQFWEVYGDAQLLALIHRAGEEEMGYRDVDALRVSAAKRPAIHRPKYSKVEVRFHGAQGDLKTFEDGRLQLSLAGLSAALAEQLQEKIREVLKSGSAEGDRLTEAA